MNEKIYLFKRAADGVWIYGPNADCEHPSGHCMIIPSTDRTKVSIIYLNKSDGKFDRHDVPVTSFYDEAGNAYANFAGLKAGYAGFFFSVSSVLSSTGVSFIDSTTGLKFRIVIRDSQFYVDKELTSTGFAGTESTDAGATGDWMTVGGF